MATVKKEAMDSMAMATCEVHESQGESSPLFQIEKALNSGYRCFIVKGAAGTGKTTLIRSLLPLLSTRGCQPLLMAPTGRAAHVLAKRTSHAASTIHSAIYNVSDEPVKSTQGDALKWVFPLKKGIDVEEAAFIVDEASMVGISQHENDRELFQFGSGSLLKDLVEFSGIRVKGSKNLLFFVGDNYQLPPVNEKCDTPPALDEKTIEELTGFRPFVLELTTVHRQGVRSGILAEATLLRSALEKKDFNRFSFTWHDDVSSVTDDEALNALSMHDGDDERIAIAYTNARVRDWNDAIRAKMGLKPNWPTIGDRLISLRNTRVATRGKDGEDLFLFYNGDFLRTTAISNQTTDIQGFYRQKNEEKPYSFTFFFCKMSVSWIGEPERGEVKDIWVNVTPILSREWDEFSPFASLALYNGLKNKIEDDLRKEYADFRRDRADKQKWDTLVHERISSSPFYRAPLVKFGYAVTGHKAQGGEWAQVFADFSRGGGLMHADYFRWAYTVTTRAVNHLYVVNPPQIDSLLTSLKQIASKSMGEVTGRGGLKTLTDILSGAGYSLLSFKRLSFRCRAIVSKTDDPANGFVDLVFNKKERITSIETNLDGMAPKDFSDLLGISVASATGMDSGNPLNPPESFSDVHHHHETCVQRILDATKNMDLHLVRAQSLTDHHLRMTFKSSSGGGELDMYFDENGKLTKPGNCTLNNSDRQQLVQCFGV